MVFIIQNAQNLDARAMQLKLDAPSREPGPGWYDSRR
jgi:low affinity Fe/Cu permease